MVLAHSYQPLQTDEHAIRVLKILPGEGTDPITLTLENVILSEVVGKYEAISYMWGPADIIQQVWIDGNFLNVRDNIWRFLKHYRKCSLRDQASFLWIDAICIDQENLEERNIQVAEMKHVYRSAHQVLIWLGRESENVYLEKRDVELVSRLYRETLVEEPLPSPYPDRKKYITATKLSRSDTPLNTVDTASANRLCKYVSMIVRNQYWRRLWVVQEMELAQELKIIQGPLLLGGDLLDVLKHAAPLPVGGDLDFRLYNSFMCLVPRTRSRAPNSCLSSLNFLIGSWCSQLCSDPRDRVYGLIGLIDSRSPAANIKVDYDIDLWLLFLQALDLMLEERKYTKVASADLIIQSVHNLACALEISFTDVQAKLGGPLPEVSNPENTWQPLSLPFRQSMFNLAFASQQPLLHFISCRNEIPISVPRQRLHRTSGRYYRDQEETLPRRVSSGQIWVCIIGRYIPIATLTLANGNLQIVGYITWENKHPQDITQKPVHSQFFTVAFPAELQSYLQHHFDENIKEIKEGWFEGRQTQISLSLLQLIQLGELGQKSTRVITSESDSRIQSLPPLSVPS